MRFLVLLIITLLSADCYGNPHKCRQFRVAVVDTGLDLSDPRLSSHLCYTGHKNFVTDETIRDIHGHGTHVVGLIESAAGNANYCILIYKYYSDSSSPIENLNYETSALQEAVNNGADIVNLSGGGPKKDEAEFEIIKNNPNVIFVVAAGNEGNDLDMSGNEFYPASYWLPNEKVVASYDQDHVRASDSNWGSKVEWEIGVKVLSLLPNNKVGYLSGTSQATATFSGKLVDKLSEICESN